MMITGRRIRQTAAAAAVAVALAVPLVAAARDAANEPDVATLLARHVEARGGVESWSAVKTMTITGTWEAFSTPGPFTVHRATPDRWRFDHRLFGAPTTFAYDGEVVWIEGAAIGVPAPTRLDEPWRRNLIEDAGLLTVLLAGPSETTRIEKLGKAEVDGMPAWALRVVRDGFPEETWYLDAGTYLELERESTTFDVFSGGIEIPMETYYDDFREVGGLVIPFHEERHFGTRYHVTDVEIVVVNPELPPGTFAPPPPTPEPPAEPEGPGSGSGGS